MSETYAVLSYDEGALVETLAFEGRDAAEAAFTDAVEIANKASTASGVWRRVELWGGDVLLGIFNTAERP